MLISVAKPVRLRLTLIPARSLITPRRQGISLRRKSLRRLRSVLNGKGLLGTAVFVILAAPEIVEAGQQDGVQGVINASTNVGVQAAVGTVTSYAVGAGVTTVAAAAGTTVTVSGVAVTGAAATTAVGGAVVITAVGGYAVGNAIGQIQVGGQSIHDHIADGIIGGLKFVGLW